MPVRRQQFNPVLLKNSPPYLYFKIIRFKFVGDQWISILIHQLFVKMMKSSAHTKQSTRSTSNSQEPQKIKKSISGTFTAKMKSQVGATVNSMINSMKQSQNRTNNSKSNKKSTSQSSLNNNKSFKLLTESVMSDSNKKIIPSRKFDKEQDKKMTVPVKNIRQKVMGASNNSKNNIKCISQKNKQNLGDSIIKKETIKNDKTNTHMCSRKKTEQSLLNFSCILTPANEPSLDMFEVGRKLGRGRFGDVYTAKDIKSGFVCAIKMINKKELKESKMQSQLIQQIKIQMFCTHPNILKMYGFFDDQNKIYLLLELATNGCLFKQIRKKKFFDEGLSSFYFRQVANGVRYLHSNYVIHRDIKPENILNCFNVLKICDFGWAIYSPLYQRQTFCGTLDYVSPQIVTGDYYDQKVDIWCLGVLCYQLCTGKAPFESKTDQNETYDKILKVDIQFPTFLSPAIVDFIGKILHRDPSKRTNLQLIQSHEWMKKYENQTGRMISKEIWDLWIRMSRG